jgi:hypothetical protein
MRLWLDASMMDVAYQALAFAHALGWAGLETILRYRANPENF